MTLAMPIADPETTTPAEAPLLIEVAGLSFCYGKNEVLRDVSLTMERGGVTAFIGPSGSGKSTLLRCLNRMNDLIDGARRTAGTVHLKGADIFRPGVDVIELRQRVGMVFQRSNPFPTSIYQNIAFGLRLQGLRKKVDLDERVERSLQRAALWDEVKDRLHEQGTSLSSGQQQRLCIARAIAVEPEILLMDEPCSALDPVATARVEELIHQLKNDFKIVIVTHNMQQAARVSDRTAFFDLGRLIEYNDTEQVFINPASPQTEAYVSGRFG